MKDLTQEQYLRAKPLYWSKRAGPKHGIRKQGEVIWIEYSKDKPPKEHEITKWPGFYPWAQDLTYDELNNHNKICWVNLNASQ